MTRLTFAAALAALLASPAAALSVDIFIPDLAWPDPVPATQACLSPVEVGTPSCKAD